ncbi:hypothetical protein [Streptomyces sp. HNM0574]|uniref:hypothetical protein n=1 Tax=Streptomyces sp. HNM0574 TaxID=2714954 RepID=UPI00146EE339|nr:hypothetical protein [Streptomyces sp. HNM0574]NLU65696.1 hypothetical protein [Streptomyces sp. HNM0574]
MTQPQAQAQPEPQAQPQDVRPEPAVVTAAVRPARRRRRPTRGELLLGLPLAALAAGVLLAVPAAALAGGGAGAAVAVVGVYAVAAVAALRAPLVRELAAPRLAVDDEGVWLQRGSRRRQGLRWAEIAAVRVVGAVPGASGRGKPPHVVRTGQAREPFADVYPVERISDDPETPLGCRVVTAQPATPGLHGRRYVVELAGPGEEVAALDRAVRHFAPEKRLTV